MKRSHFGKYGALLWMLTAQRANAVRLRRIQNDLFRRLVAQAFRHVPFYRQYYQSLGIGSAEIRDIADITILPIIDKQMLRSVDRSERLDQRFRDQKNLIEISTSGSTGQPFKFPIDRSYDQYRKAQYIHAHLSAGRRITDQTLRFSDVNPDYRGYARPSGHGWFRHFGLLREYQLFPDSQLDAQIREVDRLRPDVIHGYGSSLSLMASYAGERNIPLHSPRLIITDSELLMDDQRLIIEKGFQAPVRDIYGTFETDNIAYQCPTSDNYHIALESVILEIVKDGVPVPVGETGEVVCTVLHNHVSPLIRYSLRDMAAISPEPCGCGSPLPALRMFGGRADDYAKDSVGRSISPRSFLSRFDALADAILEYQITQPALKRFIVKVVPGLAFGESTRHCIERNMLDVFPDAEILVQTTQYLDRGRSGKLRVFVSAV